MNIVSHFVKYNIFTRATKYLSNEDKSQTICEYLVVFKQYFKPTWLFSLPYLSWFFQK